MKKFFTEVEIDSLCNGKETLPVEQRLYIFGGGNTGGDLFARLQRAGMAAQVAGFVDNNPLLKECCGLSVQSPTKLAEQHPDAMVVTALVYEEDARSQCLGLGMKNVCTSGEFIKRLGDFGELAWMQSQPDVFAAAKLWDDAESRQTYRQLIRYRISYDPKEAPPALPNQYFHPRGAVASKLSDYVDCGAFIGDTLQSFRQATGNHFNHYYAFEPSPDHYASLIESAAGDPRVKLFNMAVGKNSATMRFFTKSGGFSRLSETGNSEVKVEPLDLVLADSPVSTIKMDLEGFEPQALEGAVGILQKQRPALAICVYHMVTHLWSLPLWIHRLDLGYRFRLLHHGPKHSETVCYAIPAD